MAVGRLMTKDDLKLMSWWLGEADDNWSVFVEVRIPEGSGEGQGRKLRDPVLRLGRVLGG